MLDNMST